VKNREKSVDKVDVYNLKRFVGPQDQWIDRACEELREGRKQSHWMWFIFPQMAGLGTSDNAIRYGISSCQEAEAYSKHSILGPRLRHCTQLVMRVKGHPIEYIFGNIDTRKFRSSMTLFANAAPDGKIFADALQKFFAGIPDQMTIDLLKS
jgi:uncharacterized protein (DUF1810 family)